MRKHRGLTLETRHEVKGWHCEVEGRHYILITDNSQGDVFWGNDHNSFLSVPDFGDLCFIEVDPDTVGEEIGILDIKKKPIYGGDGNNGGDIVKITRSIRTGSKRCRVQRAYETYAINSTLTFNAAVRIGEYKVTFSNCAHIAYIDSQFLSEYPSYFWGKGKRTDKPQLIKTRYTEALMIDKEYEVIGTMAQDKKLLEDTKSAD